MSRVEVITFGCRLNAFESEIIRRAATEAGAVDTPADTIVVNTCAVTAEAERQARQAIRRARREHPSARIVVTGCAATLTPQAYAPLADLVLDNEQKLKAENYGSGGADRSLEKTDFPAKAGTHPAAARKVAEWVPAFAGKSLPGEGRVRSYLQVQQGCDHRCTFCIIPYARGPSRSIPLDALIEQARDLAENGCREIVLTGVDLTAYGTDLPGQPTLGEMCCGLLAAVPEIARLRLSSLDPSEIDEPLWHLFGDDERLMPHLHFSFQAGDDLILKRMKRRHTRDQAIAAVQRARALRPEVAIGADLIAGFPTETDEMFGRSLDLVAECGIAFLHVFPYSPRPGTPAARMPQLDPGLVRERAAELRAAGQTALDADLASRIGHETAVLVERPGLGRAAFYAPVSVDAAAPAGSVQRVRLVGRQGDKLVGVSV